jgi:hypothetical protein
VHACISSIGPEQRKPDGILHPKPLKTDMTVCLDLDALTAIVPPRGYGRD